MRSAVSSILELPGEFKTMLTVEPYPRDTDLIDLGYHQGTDDVV